MPAFIIEVKGNIVNKANCIQYAVDWVAGGLNLCDNQSDFDYDKDTRVVRSNLHLNETLRSVPYAIYVSQNDIFAELPDICACGDGMTGAFLYFNETIQSIKNVLNKPIGDISTHLFNGLYVEISSALELYLCDTLLSCMYYREEIFEKAKAEYQKFMSSQQARQKKKSKQVVINDLKVHNYYFNLVYHRLKDTATLYQNIIGIELPNYDHIEKYFRRRNNIVHRVSISNENRMEVTNATASIVKRYLTDVSIFVEEINNRINSFVRV